MIHVKRSDPPVVLDPARPEGAAALREIQKAIAHVQDPDNNPKPDFNAYRHDQVKMALANLFHGKCAYCETNFQAATPADIEHFRPKGQIDPGSGEERISPGYYWLAASWENLLLSCPNCNRRKRQLKRIEDGTWVLEEEATGKQDQFPLSDPRKRASRPEDDLDEEDRVRLLLNPCKDKVERHLRFDDEGNILPRKIQGEVSEMAKTSIEVFALKRVPLVEDRKAKYLELVGRFKERVDTATRAPANEMTPFFKDMIWAALLKMEDDLDEVTVPTKEYAGMFRWLVRGLRRRLKKVKQEFQEKHGA